MKRCARLFLHTLSTSVLLSTLSACGSLTDPLNGSYAGYSISPLDSNKVSSANGAIKAARTEIGMSDSDFLSCSEPTNSTEQCKARRNQLISVLVMASEDQCVEHRRSIYGKEATFNIASGTFTNLFSGWAAVAPSQQGQSILAALALFSNSERSLVNELVYKSVIVPAVDKKILQIRETKATQIFNRFSDSIQIYPMTLALRDTFDFHYTCSFMTGLEKAIEEGTQETTKQKVERLKRDLVLLQAQIDGNRGRGSTDVVLKNLTERYQSLSDEIKSLEKQ